MSLANTRKIRWCCKWTQTNTLWSLVRGGRWVTRPTHSPDRREGRGRVQGEVSSPRSTAPPAAGKRVSQTSVRPGNSSAPYFPPTTLTASAPLPTWGSLGPVQAAIYPCLSCKKLRLLDHPATWLDHHRAVPIHCPSRNSQPMAEFLLTRFISILPGLL